MNVPWMIETNGDPLATTRRFLRQVWLQSSLEGMLVPVYQPGTPTLKPKLLEDPLHLEAADPFAPVVTVNAAKLVSQLAEERPHAHLAAVLRSCEIRALARLGENLPLDVGHWLIIGVDCLASYPAEDYQWRVEKAGEAEALTREALQFARQGGIAPYRYRQACQMCCSPEAHQADICLGLLGLPVRQLILIIPKNQEIARQLQLNQITDGPAQPSILEQREQVLMALNERRKRSQDRMFNALGDKFPGEVASLVELIKGCAPCQECLEACPIYKGELAPFLSGGEISLEAVKLWLASCVTCGMCEQACPQDRPLAAIIGRIRQGLQQEMMAS